MPNDHKTRIELQLTDTLDRYRADLASISTISPDAAEKVARRLRRHIIKAQRRAEGWSHGR